MKKILLIVSCIFFISPNIFAQVRQMQKIGLTTLTDQGAEFTVDRQMRFMQGGVFDAGVVFKGGLVIQTSPILFSGQGITGSGNISLISGNINLLSGNYLLNNTNILSLFSGLNSPNTFTRAQNLDTVKVTNEFNLYSGLGQYLQMTPDNKWYADHYEFYSKGVKRVTIDDDSNKIKIYSGANQISLWNNGGVLDINAPVVSHGGFEAQDVQIKKTINISGVLTSVSVDVVNDTLFADSGMVFTKTLSANTSFKIHGISDGQTIKVAVTNTTGNYTVSWSAPPGLTLYWPNNSTPVQTIGAHVDIYTFERIGADIYGSVIQNYK